VEIETRMLVFCTNEQLKHLVLAGHWVMDGTFKGAPSLVTQVYAIHGSVKGKWVPLVIALLEFKNKESYVALFETLKTEVRTRFNRTLAPSRISTDYEQGAIMRGIQTWSRSFPA